MEVMAKMHIGNKGFFFLNLIFFNFKFLAKQIQNGEK
jgi:hypothetical protein